MKDFDWTEEVARQISSGIDTPEEQEMRGLVVGALCGLAIKSKGPYKANLQIFAILYHCVGELEKLGVWEQMMRTEKKKDCGCVPCVMRRKVMELLDELAKANESGALLKDAVHK